MKTSKTLLFIQFFLTCLVIKFMLCDKIIQVMVRKTSINVNSFQRFWKKFKNASFHCSHLEPSPQQQAYA